MALRKNRSARNESSRSSRGAVLRSRRRPVTERWLAWRRHHSQSAAESLARVLEQPVASIMTWLVLGIAIALPTGLGLVLDNLQTLGGGFQQPAQISLFLNSDVGRERAESLADRLRERIGVESVVFLDREQALTEFRERSGMSNLIDSLPANPLPHLLVVSPADSEQHAVDTLRSQLQALPEVDQLILDTQWLTRFTALMRLGRQAVVILAALLLAAVVLVLGNAIRLLIESRREEIMISKLVGGTDAFVRRPLLYTGLWFGLGGGVVAAALVLLGVQLLAGPVADLATAYDSSFTLRGLGLFDSLQLVLTGAVLGLAWAWSAVVRHTRNIEPV